jgi:hypothetical protein
MSAHNSNGRRPDYDAIVVGAGATLVAVGEDGAPRPLTDAEREALQR